MSTPRISRQAFWSLAPGASQAVHTLHGISDQGGLEPVLLDLVRLRASQINGCAFCVEYHTRTLRRLDVPWEKLALVAVWREAGIFSPREAAALAWTEELTRLADTKASDCAFAEARQHFSEPELSALSLAIGVINLLNRISVGFRFSPEAG